MKYAKLIQFRISHLLWITLVVAAFFCGYHVRGTPEYDQDDMQTYSFFVGVSR